MSDSPKREEQPSRRVWCLHVRVSACLCARACGPCGCTRRSWSCFVATPSPWVLPLPDSAGAAATPTAAHQALSGPPHPATPGRGTVLTPLYGGQWGHREGGDLLQNPLCPSVRCASDRREVWGLLEVVWSPLGSGAAGGPQAEARGVPCRALPAALCCPHPRAPGPHPPAPPAPSPAAGGSSSFGTPGPGWPPWPGLAGAGQPAPGAAGRGPAPAPRSGPRVRPQAPHCCPPTRGCSEPWGRGVRRSPWGHYSFVQPSVGPTALCWGTGPGQDGQACLGFRTHIQPPGPCLGWSPTHRPPGGAHTHFHVS